MKKLDDIALGRVFKNRSHIFDVDEEIIEYLPRVSDEKMHGAMCLLVVSNKALYILYEKSNTRYRIPWEYVLDYWQKRSALEIVWAIRKTEPNGTNESLKRGIFVPNTPRTQSWLGLDTAFARQMEKTRVLTETISFRDNWSMTIFVRPRAGRLNYAYVERGTADMNPDEEEELKKQVNAAVDRMITYIKENQDSFGFSNRLPEHFD